MGLCQLQSREEHNTKKTKQTKKTPNKTIHSFSWCDTLRLCFLLRFYLIFLFLLLMKIISFCIFNYQMIAYYPKMRTLFLLFSYKSVDVLFGLGSCLCFCVFVKYFAFLSNVAKLICKDNNQIVLMRKQILFKFNVNFNAERRRTCEEF